MDTIFGPIIFRPIGWFFNLLFAACGNHIAPAILLLTLTINVLLFPLSVKQQRTNAKQTAIKPQMEKLKKQYNGTSREEKMKLQQATQDLYAKEGVSMTGGCLTSFIRLPFIWAIWAVIRKPFTYMAGAYDPTIRNAVAKLIEGSKDSYAELKLIGSKALEGNAALKDVFNVSDFSLFGLDLTAIPSIKHPGLDWVFPLLAFATAMLSSFVMMKMNQKNASSSEAQTQQTMGCMMYGMPFMTLVISFTNIPAAVSFYWSISNLLSMIIQIAVMRFYGPYVTIGQGYAKTIKKQREAEAKKISRAE